MCGKRKTVESGRWISTTKTEGETESSCRRNGNEGTEQKKI
jgi:hypothetical protein